MEIYLQIVLHKFFLQLVVSIEIKNCRQLPGGKVPLGKSWGPRVPVVSLHWNRISVFIQGTIAQALISVGGDPSFIKILCIQGVILPCVLFSGWDSTLVNCIEHVLQDTYKLKVLYGYWQRVWKKCGVIAG